ASRQDGGGLRRGKPLLVRQFPEINAGYHALAPWPPTYSAALVRREGIFAGRERPDRPRGQTVGVRIVSAYFPARDRPCDGFAVGMRIIGNHEQAAGSYGVTETEALHAVGYVAHDVVERAANFAIRQLSVVPPVLDGHI